jgi:hypothetical protein
MPKYSSRKNKSDSGVQEKQSKIAYQYQVVEHSSPNATQSLPLKTKHGNTITDLASSTRDRTCENRQAVVIFCVKNRI